MQHLDWHHCRNIVQSHYHYSHTFIKEKKVQEYFLRLSEFHAFSLSFSGYKKNAFNGDAICLIFRSFKRPLKGRASLDNNISSSHSTIITTF